MLSPEQVEQYRRDGFLVVPGVVAGDELRRLQEAADRVLAEAVAHGQELDRVAPVELNADDGFYDWQPDDAGFLYARGANGERVFRRAELMWGRDPIFRAVTAHPAVLAVNRAVKEDDAVPANDAMVVKMPSAGAAVPWHRDPPGPPLIEKLGDASFDFTCDIYLDASTVDNGCVWALPGSHRKDGPADPEDPYDFAFPGAVACTAQPGDMLIHSTGVLHGSPVNASGALRRTFYVLYVTPEDMHRGFWDKDAAWLNGQADFLARASAERAGLGLPDRLPDGVADTLALGQESLH